MRASVFSLLQERQANIRSSSAVDRKESVVYKLPSSWGLQIDRKDSVKAKLSSLIAPNAVDKRITFHLFTRESYKQLLIREAEMKKKAEERAIR